MPINISFRGVMLLVRQGEGNGAVLDRVLVPLATPNTVPPGGRPGFHVDDYPARPHYPGIVVFRGGVEVARVEPLRGELQVTPAGAGPQPTRFERPGMLARLASVTNRGNGNASDLDLLPGDAPDFASRVAVTVRFRGGEMEPVDDGVAGLGWWFTEAFAQHNERNKPLALWFDWRSPAATATLRVTPAPPAGTASGELADGEMTVDGSHEVYLYNVDDQMPIRQQLIEPDFGLEPAEPMDHDFKWLYQLLVPGGGLSLGDWMRTGAFGTVGERVHLPAPRRPGWVATPLLLRNETLERQRREKLRLQRAQPADPGQPAMAAGGHPTVSTCFLSSWP